MHCVYEKNICFWWNPKCGCSFVKKLFLFLLKKEIIHQHAIGGLLHLNTQNSYQNFMKNYTHIIFIRNPYHRVVSGFLQLYIKRIISGTRRLFTHGISNNNVHEMTFEKVINIMLNNKNRGSSTWYINNHLQPQLSHYKKDIKFTKIFDLYNIDYDYLSNLFDKDISIQDINFLRETGPGHVNVQKKYEHDVYNFTINEFKDIKIIPKYKYFYNDDLKRKVRELFKRDFDFFESKGFKFDIY